MRMSVCVCVFHGCSGEYNVRNVRTKSVNLSLLCASRAACFNLMTCVPLGGNKLSDELLTHFC